ncbi:MAG: hypothetical protein WAV89_06720 [Ignavibacteriaceae bacterium]
MSIQAKSNLKKSSRVLGIVMFAFLFFFNIKFFISDGKTGNEDLSILGVKISLFENAYAETATGTCCPQNFATCVIGSYVRENAYYKSQGPC